MSIVNPLSSADAEVPVGPPPPPKGPRAITWQRRRRTFAGYWRTYRQNRQGMVGLAILTIFVLLAFFAR